MKEEENSGILRQTSLKNSSIAIAGLTILPSHVAEGLGHKATSVKLNINYFLSGIPLLLAGILLSQCQKKEEQKNPNIIFIMADDMGFGDPECYNPYSKIPTPYINSLANEGMQFTNAHSPGAWSAPTRYGLLTGRYPIHIITSQVSNAWLINENQITIAGLLKEHGYHTGMVGKWHLGFKNMDDPDYSKPLRGGPVDHGFDYYFGLHASLDIPPYFYIENDHVVQPPTDSIEESHTEGYYPVQGAFWRAGKIAPNFKHEEVLSKLTDKAVSFIEEQYSKNSEDPFFLYFAMTGPHTPWLPREIFKDSSDAGIYGDFITYVDHSLGRVLNVLEQLGIDDNTLVFFTSDNGPVWFKRDRERFDHKSTYYLRGIKGDAYEGGHRMPFLAKWPGKIKPGTKTDELICFTDILSTFSDLMGDTLPLRLQKESSSILPVLLGNKDKIKLNKGIIIEDRTVIQGGWKFIDGDGNGGLSTRYKEDGFEKKEEGELYNLAKDSTESNNLYYEYPERVEEMKAMLESIKKNN